jgi:type II secretory pathway component GspD/PulD (secretin)
VTDTGSRLKAIRSLIQRVEDPENVLSGQIRTIELKAPAETILPIVRSMLDFPDEKNVAADGSLRLAVDPTGRRLLAQGKPEKLARLDEILKVVNVDQPGGSMAGLSASPQIENYPVTSADPQTVFQVLQTLMQGLPDVRLALDSKTNNIIAQARPAEQATIKATIDQLQRDSRRMEVIRLRTVDPQTAVLAINKLFGITSDAKTTSTSAPQVDAELTTRQLLIHGTEMQVAQIRQLLQKMGESEIGGEEAANPSKVRMLSVSPRSARSILDQIQGVWPTTHRNKIREVAPSAVIPSMTPGDDRTPSAIPQHLLERPREGTLKDVAPLKMSAPPSKIPAEIAPSEENPDDLRLPSPSIEKEPEPSASSGRQAKIRFAAYREDDAPAEPNEMPKHLALPSARQEPRPPERQEQRLFESQEPRSPQKKESAENENAGAPIIVSIGPSGVMIASEDTQALDEFERLFTSLAGNTMNGSSNYTIFYLKHAKADIVAQTLDQVFGGGTVQPSDGGGNLLGDLAGSMMGDAGGGIVGSLLGMGGGSIKPSGSLRITPDPRLNALVVQANPIDVDTIEQLLKILDQKESPEDILITPKPRMIPLTNTDAEKIAEVVKQVYQDRLVSSAGAAAAQPTPQDFLQMLRGGRRGGGGGAGQGRNQADEVQKMSIGVDTRTNSLIVAAPDPLFQEVKTLVENLDVASEDTADGMKVISLHHASPDAVQSALQAIAGDSIQFNRSGGTAANNRSRTSNTQPQGMPQFGQGMGGRRNGAFGGFNPSNFGGGGFTPPNFGGGGFGPPNFGGGQNNQGGNQSGNQGGNRSGGNRNGGNRNGGGGRGPGG